MADMFEDALASIGAAIGDVREKVVEEGWFGQSLSNGPSSADTVTTVTTDAEVETPQISSPFDEAIDKMISSGCDPDLQPHGQVVDR